MSDRMFVPRLKEENARLREIVDALRARVTRLREALERAEYKLTAYVGVCTGDKELTDAVLPMARRALEEDK